uniref:Uncharacterized protein n=1 Tax=Trichuris muris TaxID=70415 RepID=A0A5S6R234_TRIMR
MLCSLNLFRPNKDLQEKWILLRSAVAAAGSVVAAEERDVAVDVGAAVVVVVVDAGEAAVEAMGPPMSPDLPMHLRRPRQPMQDHLSQVILPILLLNLQVAVVAPSLQELNWSHLLLLECQRSAVHAPLKYL